MHVSAMSPGRVLLSLNRAAYDWAMAQVISFLVDQGRPLEGLRETKAESWEDSGFRTN